MKRAVLVCLGIYAIGLQIGPWLALERASALNNGVKITNNYTGAMNSHPVWGSRIFKPGEIPNFCRPYAAQNGSGRAAVTTWQCNELSRWRDGTVVRTITNARAGFPVWSTTSGGGNGLLTNCVVASSIGTCTVPGGHGLAVSDRLTISGTPTTANAPPGGMLDNIAVMTVPSSTTFTYISRFNVSNVFQATSATPVTYNTSVVVSQKIDPLEQSNTCRYYSANHGFLKGETVTIAGDGLPTPSSATQVITAVTRNEFVTNATCTSNFTSNGTATGPDNGSLKQAIWAAFTTIPASGYTYIDFVNSTDPSSAGDAAATAAAGFDKAEMLAYQPGGNDWNFDLVATASVKSGATAAITTSARTMLTAADLTAASYCGPRIWARGPVRTWVILEYACSGALDYDFAWKIRDLTTFSAAIAAGDTEIPVASIANIDVGSLVYAWTGGDAVSAPLNETMTVTGLTCPVGGASPCITVTRATTGTARAYASGRTLGMFQWEDATAPYKSLHPRFDLSFVTGWGVKGSTIISNNWIWKNQNLWYSIDLKTGGTPASRIAKSTFKHLNSTSWRLDTWDGSDPEFYCAGGSGTDPDNCAGTGGGTRTRRYLIDYNTPYLAYTGILPEYKIQGSFSTALDAYKTAFQSSDRGAVVSGSGLGSGTFNGYPAGPATAAVKNFQNAEESYVLNHIQALCLQTWSAACYEINFGDSLPGGAGNVEAQRHIPYHFREDDDTASQPRFMMPGFGIDGRAFGRSLSLYARPTFIAFAPSQHGAAGHDIDRRRTACSNSAPAILNSSQADTLSTGQRGQPCYFYNSIGTDGWGIDSTHQNGWNELAYLITGDPRYLDSIQDFASWNTGLQSTDRATGRSWASAGETSEAGFHPRHTGGFTRAILNAAIYTPNVAQFNYTVPGVEMHYWNEKVWDMGYGREGFWDIQTGNFYTHYPAVTVAACGGPYNSIYQHVRCTVAAGKSNPLGIFGHTTANTQVWMTTSPVYLGQGMWYAHHTVVQWGRAHALGMPMFDYARARWANLAFAMWGNSIWNPWMNDLDVSPTKIGSEYVQTMQEMWDGLKTPSWTDAGVTSTRNDTDWCHPNTSDNCGTTNIDYESQWRPNIASLKDLSATVSSNLDGCPVGGCTWQTAWDWITANITMPPAGGYAPNVTSFSILPWSRITDLVCIAGTGICTYTAPTADACYYKLSTTAFTDSLDTGAVSDGGGAIARTLPLTVTVGVPNYLQLTCGQRVSGAADGTARALTSFTPQIATVPSLSGKVGISGKVAIH